MEMTLNEILKVIGTILPIGAACFAIGLWVIKKAIAGGEFYKMFKDLVKEVANIRSMMDVKFKELDERHDIHRRDLNELGVRVTRIEAMVDSNTYTIRNING